MLTPWKKSCDQPRHYIKKQRHYFANKGPSSQSYGFSHSHVCMWELDYKESWVGKNWCFWTVMLEKTVESPLDCKETQPVHPKGNQSWIFVGRTDAEAATPILRHLMRRTDSLKRPWCWERLKVGWEGDDRRWDGWMASPTPRTWVWVTSGSWWWTGKPGILQSIAKSGTGLSDSTELTCKEEMLLSPVSSLFHLSSCCNPPPGTIYTLWKPCDLGTKKKNSSRGCFFS